jgi:hypothetical protein
MFTQVAVACHTHPYWKPQAPTMSPAPAPDATACAGKTLALAPAWKLCHAARKVAALTPDGSSAYAPQPPGAAALVGKGEVNQLLAPAKVAMNKVA